MIFDSGGILTYIKNSEIVCIGSEAGEPNSAGPIRSIITIKGGRTRSMLTDVRTHNQIVRHFLEESFIAVDQAKESEIPKCGD